MPLQWRCMMMLFVTTGIRRGEACGLIWQDINFQEATLSISRNVTYSKEQGVKVGPTKTENSVRTLPLSASMVTLLRMWKREQSKLNPLLPTAFVFANIDDPYQPMFPTSPTRWLHTFTKKTWTSVGLSPRSPAYLRQFDAGLRCQCEGSSEHLGPCRCLNDPEFLCWNRSKSIGTGF